MEMEKEKELSMKFCSFFIRNVCACHALRRCGCEPFCAVQHLEHYEDDGIIYAKHSIQSSRRQAKCQKYW